MTSAAIALPGLSGEEEQDGAERTSGIFDAETIAAARDEIEQELAAADDGERRSLLVEQLDELDRAERLLEERANPEPLPAVDPPFSLRDLDRTLERMQTVSERSVTLEGAVRSAESALDRATRVLDDTRARFADGSVDRVAVRVANERVRLARFQLHNARIELAVAEDWVERLTGAAEEKRRRLQITEEDLTARD